MPELTLSEIKGPIIALVVGIIVLIVGAVSGTIAQAIGSYIITTLNTTGGIAITKNYVADVSNIVSPVFSIAGVALIVMASVWIIKLLRSTTEEMT